jgi:hypothetical protein
MAIGSGHKGEILPALAKLQAHYAVVRMFGSSPSRRVGRPELQIVFVGIQETGLRGSLARGNIHGGAHGDRVALIDNGRNPCPNPDPVLIPTIPFRHAKNTLIVSPAELAKYSALYAYERSNLSRKAELVRLWSSKRQPKVAWRSRA